MCAGLERGCYLQVTVKALDPSKTEYSASDIDSVSLTRKLALGLQKSSSYVEAATGADTIEYSFEVSKPRAACWRVPRRSTVMFFLYIPQANIFQKIRHSASANTYAGLGLEQKGLNKVQQAENLLRSRWDND